MPSAFDGEKKPVCIHGSTCKACWGGAQQSTTRGRSQCWRTQIDFHLLLAARRRAEWPQNESRLWEHVSGTIISSGPKTHCTAFKFGDPRRGPSPDWPRSRLWFRVPYRSGQAPTNGPPTYTAYAGEPCVEIRPMSGISYRLKSATDWQMAFLWEHASNFPQYGKPSTQITCTRCGNANYICAPYHMTALPVKRIRLQSS